MNAPPLADLKHPMQPVGRSPNGNLRFKANTIVEYLLNHGGIDMNKLALLHFEPEEREHFAQLIGYSVSGYADLSYASPDVVKRAYATALAPGEAPGIVFAVSNDGGKTGVAWRDNLQEAMAYCDKQNANGGDYAVVAVRRKSHPVQEDET
jgi:hypothetical protein